MNTKTLKQAVIHYGLIGLGILTVILEHTLSADTRRHTWIMAFGTVTALAVSNFSKKQQDTYKQGETIGDTIETDITSAQGHQTMIDQHVQALVNKTGE